MNRLTSPYILVLISCSRIGLFGPRRKAPKRSRSTGEAGLSGQRENLSLDHGHSLAVLEPQPGSSCVILSSSFV